MSKISDRSSLNLRRASTIAMIVVGLAAAVQSWQGLTALGVQYGMPTPFLTPVIVDGAMLVGALVVLRATVSGQSPARGWITTLVGVSLSTWGNIAAHGGDHGIGGYIVYAAAPVLLAITIEHVMWEIRTEITKPAPRQRRRHQSPPTTTTATTTKTPPPNTATTTKYGNHQPVTATTTTPAVTTTKSPPLSQPSPSAATKQPPHQHGGGGSITTTKAGGLSVIQGGNSIADLSADEQLDAIAKWIETQTAAGTEVRYVDVATEFDLPSSTATRRMKTLEKDRPWIFTATHEETGS